MQKYDVKRGLEKNLQPTELKAIVQESFGNASEEQGKVVASFGALARLTAWADGKILCVEAQMKIDVPNDVAAETIRCYNSFLERATGYNAKQRGKKAQERVKKGGP